MEVHCVNQLEIDILVAAATGETVSEVQRLGFSLADPLFVEYDPEPSSCRTLPVQGHRWLAAELLRSRRST